MNREFVLCIACMGLVFSGCSNAVSDDRATASTPTATAPSNLSYSNENASYLLGAAITANTPSITGTPTGYTVSPELPAGLVHPATGVITGTPSVLKPAALYTITARNDLGTAAKEISIAIVSAVGTTTVSGTITMPISIPSSPYAVVVDNDDIDSNGGSFVKTGTATGTSFAYTINNVSPGSFRMYVYVFVKGQALVPPVPGDYYARTTSNIAIPATGTIIQNFTCQIIPEYSSPASVGDITKFGITSYFPIVEGMTWTDNGDKTVKMVNVNAAQGTFRIENVGNETYGINGKVCTDADGTYIDSSGWSNPNFIGTFFGFSPFMRETLAQNQTWTKASKSNGYDVNTSVIVDAVGVSITPIGGTTYSDCIKITATHVFPNGYDQSTYVTKFTVYYQKGIGCVQAVSEYNNATTSTRYIKAYSMP